jgi:hypothetical protein
MPLPYESVPRPTKQNAMMAAAGEKGDNCRWAVVLFNRQANCPMSIEWHASNAPSLQYSNCHTHIHLLPMPTAFTYLQSKLQQAFLFYINLIFKKFNKNLLHENKKRCN